MNQIKSNEDIDFFTKRNTDCLKGYLAILVLISHMYQFSGLLSGTNIGNLLNMFGHYGVIGFMFLSGFGLCTSYLVKKKSYLKEFPHHRLLPFFVTYCIAILTYFIFETALGNRITGMDIIESLTFGNTIVSFGWYLQLTLWLYLIFYIIYILPVEDWAKSIFMGVLAVTYIFIRTFLSAAILRSVPLFSFILGFIFAYHKDYLTGLIKKFRYIFVPACLLFIAVYFKVDYAKPSKWIQLSACILADLAFITLMLLAMYFCNSNLYILIKNPISVFFGKYSLEIYIIQAIFLRLFYSYIKNVYLYLTVSVVAIIIFSIPYHFLISKVWYFISGGIIKKEK